MADIGYVRRLLAGIPDATTKRVVTEAFEHVLGNLRYGVPEHQRRAENFQAYYIASTTSTTADQEFSVVHGLATTPRVAFAALDLNTVGAKTVRLRVTRAADTRRIYLASPETAAPITVVIE